MGSDRTRTRIVHVLAAIAALWIAHPLWAGEPIEVKPGQTLLSGVAWLRLEVVGGRLTAATHRCSQARVQLETPETAAVCETLSVETRVTQVALRYEATRPEGTLLVEIDARGKLVLDFAPQGTAAKAVRLVQPPCGAVTLELKGKQPRVIRAADLWQLLLVERDACREHLLPVLKMADPRLKIDETVSDAESLLVSLPAGDTAGQHREWRRWVADLSSESFSERQTADRNLRACGQPLLAFLRQLDPKLLDSEQRRRVRAIVTDLNDGQADSPERIVEWLAGDKRVWLSLLARGELEQRIAAARHLARMCEKPLVYDPEASPAQRDAQLAALTAQLADN